MYYAVKNGRHPGVYSTWEECLNQVMGFSNAKYKKFSNVHDAVKFLKDENEEIITVNAEENTNFYNKEIENNEYIEPFVFTDGSFIEGNNYYGSGVFIKNKERVYPYAFYGNNPEYIKSRNVAGELAAVMYALNKCIQLNYSEIHLYYDYVGIENWATGTWKCNKNLTKIYKSYYDKCSKNIKVHFHHVKGHSGNEYNELVDKLAKKDASDIPLLNISDILKLRENHWS